MTPSPALPPRDAIHAAVAAALAEDVGDGDITAALVPADATVEATVITRESCVLCGSAWFETTFLTLDSATRIEWLRKDGDHLDANETICTLRGKARALLTGERTALNFLQMLSGTATVTAHYAAALTGTQAKLLDTRKTIPGLRLAQKYAVRCGGGTNHRIGLYDAYLIKENHIAAAGSIALAIAAARTLAPGKLVEVEVETMAQLDEALAHQADIVMLDNFDVDDTRAAVARNAGRAKLEASGNVDLDRLAQLAAMGVDYISVGALTKHVRAIDLSMRFSRHD